MYKAVKQVGTTYETYIKWRDRYSDASKKNVKKTTSKVPSEQKFIDLKPLSASPQGANVVVAIIPLAQLKALLGGFL